MPFCWPFLLPWKGFCGLIVLYNPWLAFTASSTLSALPAFTGLIADVNLSAASPVIPASGHSGPPFSVLSSIILGWPLPDIDSFWSMTSITAENNLEDIVRVLTTWQSPNSDIATNSELATDVELAISKFGDRHQLEVSK